MRGTLIGRQATYGSSCSLRPSLSVFIEGSSGSSPGFNPPSRSMSAFEPPPSQGPVKSGWPSASLGTGPFTRLSGSRGVPPAGKLVTRFCASVCRHNDNVRVVTAAETMRILFTITSAQSEIELSAELEHPAAENQQRPQPLAPVRAGVARGHAEHVARVEQVVEVAVAAHPELPRAERL